MDRRSSDTVARNPNRDQLTGESRNSWRRSFDTESEASGHASREGRESVDQPQQNPSSSEYQSVSAINTDYRSLMYYTL